MGSVVSSTHCMYSLGHDFLSIWSNGACDDGGLGGQSRQFPPYDIKSSPDNCESGSVPDKMLPDNCEDGSVADNPSVQFQSSLQSLRVIVYCFMFYSSESVVPIFLVPPCLNNAVNGVAGKLSLALPWIKIWLKNIYTNSPFEAFLCHWFCDQYLRGPR